MDDRERFQQLAEHFGYSFVWIENGSVDDRGVYAADWGLMSRNQAFLDDGVVKARAGDTAGISTALRPWTDDYSNLLDVLKWWHE